MNTLMLAALPATARPPFPSTTSDDPHLTRAGLTPVDAARIGEALAATRTDGTRRLYDVVWGQWQRWCAQRGVTAVPADPLTVCAYLTERAEAGRATGTLDMACTVIRHVHRTTGAVDPIASEAVRQVRRGLRRTYGAAPRRLARPLSVEDIRRIVGIPTGALRTGCATPRSSCSATPPPCAAPSSSPSTSPTSNTSPPGSCRTSGTPRRTRRATANMSPSPTGTTPPPTPSPRSAPGLICAARPRRPVRQGLGERYHLRTALGPRPRPNAPRPRHRGRARRHPDHAHSLRAGHATTAALAGVPLHRIAAQTRPKDLTVVVNRYIRPLEARHTSSKDLGL